MLTDQKTNRLFISYKQYLSYPMIRYQSIISPANETQIKIKLQIDRVRDRPKYTDFMFLIYTDLYTSVSKIS